eukprot:6626403-Prymnesium_polylepis.1
MAKGSHRVCTDSRQFYASSPQIRDGFAHVRTSSHKLARICAGCNTVPSVTRTNAYRCGVTSPVYESDFRRRPD